MSHEDTYDVSEPLLCGQQPPVDEPIDFDILYVELYSSNIAPGRFISFSIEGTLYAQGQPQGLLMNLTCHLLALTEEGDALLIDVGENILVEVNSDWGWPRNYSLEARMQLPVDMPQGTYQFAVTCDPDDCWHESDEDNNTVVAESPLVVIAEEDVLQCEQVCERVLSCPEIISACDPSIQEFRVEGCSNRCAQQERREIVMELEHVPCGDAPQIIHALNLSQQCQ